VIDELKHRNLRASVKSIGTKHDVMKPLRVDVMELDFNIADDIAMPIPCKINALPHSCDGLVEC
jgi:hypothetical protein